MSSDAEIELKFLIRENGVDYYNNNFNISLIDVGLESGINGKRIDQGYFSVSDGKRISEEHGFKYDFTPVEYRLRKENDEYFFTAKSEGGELRREKNEVIDKNIFEKYWMFTEGKRVKKIRVEKEMYGKIVEIDNYLDRDLIVAEIEFNSLEELRKFPKLGLNVTEDKNYKNKNLAK